MRDVIGKGKYRHRRLIALAAVCLLAAGCGREPEPEDDFVMVDQEELAEAYITTAATVSDVARTTRLRCIYAQVNETELTTQAMGKKVETVYVRPGDTVEKGQLLAVLTGGDKEEEIRELEYRIARNKLLLGYTDQDEAFEISYRWWDYLYRSSLSEADTDQLESSLEDIRQNYRYRREDYEDSIELDMLKIEALREEMSQSRLYADTDGIISYMYNTLLPVGTQVPVGEALIRIADDSACIFESTQTSNADCFQEGQVLQLELDAGSGQGTVDVIPYKMENWGDKLYFEVADKENTTIPAGTGGSIVITSESRSQVLTIPKEALYTAGVRNFVYVEGEDNFREVRWVETGLTGDRLVEIISGLSEGEEVIVR